MKLEIDGTQEEVEEFCFRIASGVKDRADSVAADVAAAFSGGEARGVHDQIVGLLRVGEIIKAIKLYRQVMGSSLRDAKHVIDFLKADNRIP